MRGGACVFVRTGLDFTIIKPPNITQESIWISIKTHDKINRLYGCIYRSPNSSNINNENLLSNLKWASENFTEIILIGDFNIPQINWLNYECSNVFAQSFLETILDCYMEQLLLEPTRFREGQNPS